MLPSCGAGSLQFPAASAEVKGLGRPACEEAAAATCSLGRDSQAVMHTAHKCCTASYKTRARCLQHAAGGREGGKFRNPFFSTHMAEIPRSSPAGRGIRTN